MPIVAIKNTGTSVSGWAANAILWWVYPAGLTCQQAEAQFSALSLAQKLSQTVSAQPAPATGKKWQARSCTSDTSSTTNPTSPLTGDTFVSADNQGYTPPVDNSGSDPVPVPVSSTVVSGMNPEYFAPALQWQNGKARIVNMASLPGPVLYWLYGLPPMSALPTTYDYSPGDLVSIMVAVTSSPYVQDTTWTQKASVNILIGPVPL